MFPLTTFTLGLFIGRCVLALSRYRKRDAKRAESVRQRLAAADEATKYRNRANRLAAELATAEMEIRHLRRQLGYDADGDAH